MPSSSSYHQRFIGSTLHQCDRQLFACYSNHKLPRRKILKKLSEESLCRHLINLQTKKVQLKVGCKLRLSHETRSDLLLSRERKKKEEQFVDKSLFNELSQRVLTVAEKLFACLTCDSC